MPQPETENPAPGGDGVPSTVRFGRQDCLEGSPRQVQRQACVIAPCRVPEPTWKTPISMLAGLGIPIMAVATPLALRTQRVLFNGRRFTYCDLGDDAIIIGIIDGGLIEEVAWCPTSGRLATRDGVGFALGQGQLGRDGRGTTGLPIPVHRSPLGWLKADRCGIVIVDWEIATFGLRGLILEAEDEAHRRALARRLTPTPPKIVVSARRTAA